jgi:hypothetical protein
MTFTYTQHEIDAALEYINESVFDYHASSKNDDANSEYCKNFARLTEEIESPLFKNDQKMGAMLHAAAIPSSFEHDYHSSGTASLVGQTVSSPKDVGLLSQIYRHPKFETFHALYTRGDVVVGHHALTNRLPGSVAVTKSGESLSNFHDTINEKARHLSATGVYIMHNHPSGDSTPSTNDVEFTKKMLQSVPMLKGHVVINHTFHTISPDGNVVEHPLDKTEKALYSLTDYFAPHDVIGTKMRRHVDFAIAAKQFHKPGNVTLVGIGADAKIVGVSSFPSHLLEAGDKIHTLKTLARSKRFLQHVVAGSSGVIVTPSKDDIQKFVHHMNHNIIGNVVSHDGTNAIDLRMYDQSLVDQKKLSTFGGKRKIINVIDDFV